MAVELSFREAYFKARESVILEIREEQAQRLSAIPEEALTWLALVPEWTLPLALSCDFPSNRGTGLAETFRQIKEAGYCDSVSPPTLDDPDEELLGGSEREFFWMPNSTRTEMLQRIVQDTTRGLPYLQRRIKLISEKLDRARSSGLPLPDSVQRWTVLAAMAESRFDLANWLDRKIDELLGGNEPGELLRWIEVARPLEELLGNELTTTLGRASRRLELHHRLENDKRRLTKFLKRDEQIKAFMDLVDNRSGGWALHYIGSGGIGKTMLIRYLTGQLAPSLGASTARIDFDYLNPDYPAHAPGYLLAQLAEELRVHDRTGTATDSFASFIEKVSNLHERLSASASGAQLSLPALMAPIYDMLPHFVEALNQLPKPIIIILDTCEELAKIRVDGTIPPSVQATFDILEHLHDLQPDIRVVFGGRRPLASAGAGWVYPGSALLPRRYLRAHEILGFTLEEATRYLTEIEKVPPETVGPIISHSLIKTRESSSLYWNGIGPEAGKVNRYHPFDLSLYAAWIHEDPDLTLDAIKSTDVDRYIEMRIVHRLRHPGLRDLLPAAALMGRFDFKTLRLVSAADDVTFNNLFLELSNQEWINRQSATFLEVNPGLQPRLLSYYQMTKPTETEVARRTLIAHLEKVTIEEDRSQLDVSYFRTLFRLLKPEPQRAARWWARVETRFADEEAYDWLRNVCELIMGDEDNPDRDTAVAAAARQPGLRAALLASYAAALTHIGPFDKLEETWAEVLLGAYLHPIPAEAGRLHQRARAGRLAAAARYNPQGPDEGQVKWLWQTLKQCSSQALDRQLAGSYVAAAEAMLELLETQRHRSPLNPAPLIQLGNSLLKSTLDQGMACFASALTGRMAALSGRRSEASEWFRQSMGLPLEAVYNKSRRFKIKSIQVSSPRLMNLPEPIDAETITPQTWLDWRAPEQLDARIRLEFIRGMDAVLSSSEILALVGDNVPEPITIDTDRLGSAIIVLRAAGSLPLNKESGDLAWKSRHSIQHEPLCYAHRRFPPLFAAVAEAMAAEGKVDEAVGRLSRESAAAETVEQFATVLESDRALLRIAKRMRLRDEDMAAYTSVHSSVEFQDVSLLWAIEALSNPKKATPSGIAPLLEPATDQQRRLALLHARFRTAYALQPEMAKGLILWITQALQPVERLTTDATSAELDCFVDCLEANLISHRHGLLRPFPQLRLEQAKATNFWRDEQSPPLERLTLRLRLAALSQDPSAVSQLDKTLIESVGYRGAAKIALDEGELLALRLPEHAARLLNQANRWLIKATDYVAANVAKICQSLALAKSHRNAALSAALKRVQKDYAHCQNKNLRSLPRWERLESIAGNPQAKALDHLTPLGWRPWLIRLIACLAWQKDEYQLGPRSQLLARWLATNYGSKSVAGTTLPAEFEDWLTAEAPLTESIRAESFISISMEKKTTVWQSLERNTEVLLSLHGETKPAKRKVAVMGLVPYRMAAKDLMSQLAESGAAAQPELTAFTTFIGQEVIRLRIDHPSSWICWEGIIGSALRDVAPITQEPLRFQREVRDSKQQRKVTWEKAAEILTWTNDLNAAEMAREGWIPIGLASTSSHQIIDSESISARRYDRNAQVLHVIGSPMETSAGVRLDLSSTRVWRQGVRSKGTGGGSRSGSAKSAPSSIRGTGSGAPNRGSLIKAENLYSVLPKMAMCILQATPRATGAERARTQSDREQAAYLRLMGAELFTLGVPVVLTIPAIAPEVAPTILRLIAERFLYFQGKFPKDSFLLRSRFSGPPASGTRWSTGQAIAGFLSFITEAQALVKQSMLMSEEDAEEIALDFSLYAADVRS